MKRKQLDCLTRSVPTPIETGFEAHRVSSQAAALLLHHSVWVTLGPTSPSCPTSPSARTEHPAGTWAAGTPHSPHAAPRLRTRKGFPRTGAAGITAGGLLPPKPPAQHMRHPSPAPATAAARRQRGSCPPASCHPPQRRCCQGLWVPWCHHGPVGACAEASGKF